MEQNIILKNRQSEIFFFKYDTVLPKKNWFDKIHCTYTLKKAFHGGAVVPVAEKSLLGGLPDPLVYHPELKVVHQHMPKHSRLMVTLAVVCGFIYTCPNIPMLTVPLNVTCVFI